MMQCHVLDTSNSQLVQLPSHENVEKRSVSVSFKTVLGQQETRFETSSFILKSKKTGIDDSANPLTASQRITWAQ